MFSCITVNVCFSISEVISDFILYLSECLHVLYVSACVVYMSLYVHVSVCMNYYLSMGTWSHISVSLCIGLIIFLLTQCLSLYQRITAYTK